MKITFAIFFALAVVSHLALAQSPPKDWDHWYTVTVDQKTPYEYYHETIKTKEGRLIYQLHAWKKEEDFINEEQLGAFAKESDLEPLFFNFHSTYRGSEKTIDGNVQDKNLLVIKISEGSSGGLKELPLIRRPLGKKIFLSSFFPLWLSRHATELKPGRSLSFTSILEDGGDGTPFANAGGSVKIGKESGQYEVNFRGQKTKWWVDPQGVPTRIEMPKSHAVVERVSESKAKAFLGSGP